MKIKIFLLACVILCNLATKRAKAQQFVNGDFESNTPIPNQFNCDLSPWGWSASISSLYSPITGMQWENRWNTSWWIDMTDCGWGNGRWMEQSVATTPGKKYYLYFDIGASQWVDGGADLYINGTFVGQFLQPNDGVTPLLWKTFSYCFIASTPNTTFRWVCHANGTNAPAVGFDNARLDSLPNLSLVVNGRCVPAILGFTGPSFGTANWLYNGTPFASGTNTITCNNPGMYTLKYITTCGDTITRDTLLVDCDSCKVNMTSDFYCVRDCTIFSFNLPPCLDPRCMGAVQINFGDGTSASSTGGGPVRFAHRYNTAGTYVVNYCWTNACTGKVSCNSSVINIMQCGPCWIHPDFTFNTVCNPIQFTYTGTANYHVLSMSWNFGDGTTSSATNPLHSFPGNGSYNVCLTVTTAGPNGTTCRMTICKMVNVQICFARSFNQINISKGIEEMFAPDLKLFPNPAKENVTISGIPVGVRSASIEVYDITGRLLVKEDLPEGKPDINISLKQLQQGTYLLKFKAGNFQKDMRLVKE
jgi:hypothetical protein